MKLLNMSIAFLVSFNLCAQIVDLNKEVSWDRIETTLSDDKKLEIVSNVNEDLIYFLKDNKLMESSLKNFHFIDLNGDNILDFIYVGYAGGEQPSTLALTQNEKGLFKRVFEASGTIYEITNIALVEKKFKFKVLKNDECYDCLGVKNSTTYLVNNGIFTKIEVISFTENTSIPSFVFKRRFKVLNPKYYLRTNPTISNEGNKPDVLFGNVVAEYGSGAKGYAFASHEDETGRIWWFVALKSKECSKALFQQKEGYYLGWMSSRYLEEL